MTSDPSQTEHRSPRSNAAPNGTSAPSSEAGPTAQAPPAAPVVNTKPAASWTERFHVMQGVLPIDPSRVSIEVVAGVTLAALAIPEVMGYTAISGTPVVTGLYTILLPIAVFALLGSSRHLVVGADSATAAILAAGLVVLATPQSPSYVALAAAAALMTAGWLILARIIGLAFLADFLSRSVLVGFLTGVGIQVAAGQIAGMLGVPGGGSGTIDKALTALSQLPQANLPTLIVSASVLVVIVGLRLVARQIPGALIAVVGSIVASYVFDLAAIGVKPLGPVPGGLPTIGLPDVALSSLPPLLPTTFAMFVVILAQSAATSRAYAARYEERHDENTDLVGLSLANVAAGITGTFVVNGSPTKTQMVDSAGGRSQLSQLACAVVVLIVLLFLTGPLAFMPNAVLAAIVFLIGVELVDIKGMRRVLDARPREFWVALLTAVVVVAVGVEQAIIVAMALSLISHTRRGYDPHNSVLVPTPQGFFRPVPVADGGQAAPGLVIYRFTHSLYYANAQRFQDEVLALTKPAAVPTRWVCVDGTAIDDVDFTAGAMLGSVARTLHERQVRLVFADVSDHVREELDRSGVTEVVGKDAYFEDLDEARKEVQRDAA
jgi:high affinity sulfate transporter 1